MINWKHRGEEKLTASRLEWSAASGESPRRWVTVDGGDYERGQEKGEGKGVWLGFIGLGCYVDGRGAGLIGRLPNGHGRLAL